MARDNSTLMTTSKLEALFGLHDALLQAYASSYPLPFVSEYAQASSQLKR